MRGGLLSNCQSLKKEDFVEIGTDVAIAVATAIKIHWHAPCVVCQQGLI